MEKEMLKIVKRRFINIKKRSEILGIPPPKFDDLIIVFEESLASGFMCSYCGEKLVINGVYPYRRTPSIDHKLPLTSGGGNDSENLTLCCFECNIVKGTLDSDIFLELLDLLKGNDELRRKIFYSWFKFRFANKLERLKMEKDKFL